MINLDHCILARNHVPAHTVHKFMQVRLFEIQVLIAHNTNATNRALILHL